MSNRLSLFVLSLVLLTAAESSAGFMPNRPRTRRPRTSGGAILQRGPRYENAPTGAMSSGDIQAAIQANRPGVNDIALQSAGLAGAGNCGHGAKDRLASITAELQSIYSSELAASAGLSGCNYLDTACQQYWYNLGVQYAKRAFALADEAAGLQGQIAAEAACAQGSGFGSPVNPPGISYENLAQRFGVPLKGSSGGFGGGFNGSAGSFGGGAWGFRSSTLDALREDVDNGRIPDYDGSRGRTLKAAADFQRAADAAAAVGAKVRAGKAFAGKPATDFDDPDAAARREYLRINYDVLGDKYAALAQDRRQKADAFADQALAGRPDLPLVSDQPPVRGVEAPSDGGEGLLGKVADGLKDEAQDRAEEFFTKGLDEQGKALLGIAKIDGTVLEGVGDLAKALPGAVAELGSAGLEHPNIDKIQGALDGFFEKTGKLARDQMAEISGVPADPESAVKSGTRSWWDKHFGGGSD